MWMGSRSAPSSSRCSTGSPPPSSRRLCLYRRVALFEIICKGDTWFAYSNAEKDSVVAKLKGKNCDIQRSKGLGENDPDMMWLTTMNPDTRRLIKVMPEDVEQTATMFDLLLGDDLQGRKNYIASDGHLFLDLADIS